MNGCVCRKQPLTRVVQFRQILNNFISVYYLLLSVTCNDCHAFANWPKLFMSNVKSYFEGHALFQLLFSPSDSELIWIPKLILYYFIAIFDRWRDQSYSLQLLLNSYFSYFLIFIFLQRWLIRSIQYVSNTLHTSASTSAIFMLSKVGKACQPTRGHLNPSLIERGSLCPHVI